MTKEEVQKRVLHNGEPISLDDFSWDENTRTFSSELDNLVLDFNGIDSCTFDTSSSCTFKTGSSCTFDTVSGCIFNTSSSCTFDTGYDCTFDTGSECVIVRRDLFEVIQPKESTIYRLNANGVPGYTESESNPELFV